MEIDARFVWLALSLILTAQPALAWGPDGHRVVGTLAIGQFTPQARSHLQEILLTSDPAAMAESCNWPDDFRATDAGAWSGPQHYINVPRSADNYDRQRDCAGGACSAEALKKYALVLGDRQASREERWQAWAWVCHLAGDIHQPMHSGYAHDRGGNDFQVVFRGREMNLHAFWDHALVEFNYTSWMQLARDLQPLLQPVEDHAWNPDDADRWVRESHQVLRRFGYPEPVGITREFAASRWLLARQQLTLAGTRLAALVNAALGDRP